jgi:hypothetical protein
LSFFWFQSESCAVDFSLFGSAKDAKSTEICSKQCVTTVHKELARSGAKHYLCFSAHCLPLLFDRAKWFKKHNPMARCAHSRAQMLESAVRRCESTR